MKDKLESAQYDAKLKQFKVDRDREQIKQRELQKESETIAGQIEERKALELRELHFLASALLH